MLQIDVCCYKQKRCGVSAAGWLYTTTVPPAAAPLTTCHNPQPSPPPVSALMLPDAFTLLPHSPSLPFAQDYGGHARTRAALTRVCYTRKRRQQTHRMQWHKRRTGTMLQLPPAADVTALLQRRRSPSDHRQQHLQRAQRDGGAAAQRHAQRGVGRVVACDH